MRVRPRQRRQLAFWLLAITVIAVWVWRWPASRPVQDSLDYLGSLGYQCAQQPEREIIYVCSDEAGGDPIAAETKTTLWLHSPYEVAEAEELMSRYCQDQKLEALWAAGLNPTAWEIDRRIVVMPHELYGREDILDQYTARQVWLGLVLQQAPTFSMVIDLETRCQWYQLEPTDGGLI